MLGLHLGKFIDLLTTLEISEKRGLSTVVF